MVRLFEVPFMVAVFILIAVAAYWPSRQKSIEEHGKIILGDDR